MALSWNPAVSAVEIFEIVATWPERTEKKDGDIPLCSNIENLPEPECTTADFINKPSRWFSISACFHFERVQSQAGNRQCLTAAKQII